jgi:hypothetical protein
MRQDFVSEMFRFLCHGRSRPAVRKEGQSHILRECHRLGGAGRIRAQIIQADRDNGRRGIRRPGHRIPGIRRNKSGNRNNQSPLRPQAIRKDMILRR